jgi:hypothetical protein
MDQQLRMAAEWDTMALILLHEGKFTQALGYATAAIHVTNTDDVRADLIAISAVTHHPATAASLRADDQKLRTFAVGPAAGHQGVIYVTLLLADGKVIDSTSENTASPAPPLSDVAKYLKAADLRALFPPGSKAHLIRSGFVNCHIGGCELILAPIRGLQVINVRPPETKTVVPLTRTQPSH